MRTKLAVFFSVLCLTAVPAASATGGWYIGDFFISHGQLLDIVRAQEGNNDAEDVVVIDVRVEDGHIVVEVLVDHGDDIISVIRIDFGGDLANPNAEYVPDSSPALEYAVAPCIEAHYTDEGWDEGDC